MDLAARKRFIIRTVWLTIPAPFVVGVIAYRTIPAPSNMGDPAARLALAAKWLVVAMLPYALSCLSIAGLRFFEGSHDPTKAGESQRVKILCRVMQNTLEQLVWFAIALCALAVMAPEHVKLVPVACVFFALARAIYWWGYARKDTLGRAPGVQLTFSLNVQMLLAALYFLAR